MTAIEVPKEGLTNLNVIKQKAIRLLGVPLQQTSIPFIVSHPFASSVMFFVKRREVEELVAEIPDLEIPESEECNTPELIFNIFEYPNLWRAILKKQILKQNELARLIFLINKPYQLFFFSLIKNDISSQELGTLLGTFWQSVENISTDCNVASEELIRLFQKSDKSSIMNKNEFKKYCSLPDEVILWRGVTDYNIKNEKALSWTDNKDTALWFANRFPSENSELWEIKIPKEQVLACFDYENEYIVDMCSCDIFIKKETL